MTEAALIVALDIATTTGVAYGRVGEAPRFMSQSFRADTSDISGHVDASAKAQVWAIDFLNTVQPDFLVIEAPLEFTPHGGNANTTIRLTSLVSIVGAVAKNLGYAVRFGKVSTVRSAFLGRGNGNLPGDFAKREVMRFCLGAGWKPSTLDQADAGALWWWFGNELQPQTSQPMSPLLLKILPVQRPVKGENIRRAPQNFRRPENFDGGAF
ncbi:MAG: hypothetical protein JWM36_3189 [Hyphomicrobiales bacterium]|nr:hypothetical protein [Hyphomicrobiales bacterium]